MSEPLAELLNWMVRIKDRGLMSILPELIEGPSLAVCERLVQLMRHSYWQDKNLALAIRLGQSGVIYAQTCAGKTESTAAKQLRANAKGFAYDIGSFAWVGWDEPGKQIDEPTAAFGLEAATLNLSLAVDLERGDLPTSRAYWLFGAHQVTNGQFAAALASFNTAADLAGMASTEADQKLSQAFAALAELFCQSDDGAEQRLQTCLESLSGLEHGDSFVAQVTTAHAVCKRLG